MILNVLLLFGGFYLNYFISKLFGVDEFSLGNENL